MKPVAAVRGITLLAAALVLSSCTAARLCERGPATHFVPPNSNVKTLGPVAVHEMSNSKWMDLSIKTGKDDLAIYNRALARVAGADVIVDWRRVITVKYCLLPFCWRETEFEGTAAKIVMGKQDLEGRTRAERLAAEGKQDESPVAAQGDTAESARPSQSPQKTEDPENPPQP